MTPKAGFARLVIRVFIPQIWCSWRCANALPTANPAKLPMEMETNPRPQSGRWWWKVKAEKKTKQEEANLPVKTKIQREIIAWFWVGLVFLLINGTIGQPRVIPSGSMENTLLIGDHLIMSRIGYDAGVPFTNWPLPVCRNPNLQQVLIFKRAFAPRSADDVQ